MSPNDQILIRTPVAPGQYRDDLDFVVGSPDIRQGIIPWIRNFGSVYHVKLTQQTWSAKFSETKKQLLSEMLGALTDPVVVENVDYKLKMIKDCRGVNRWRFPSIMDQRSGTLCWVNGHSRLIAAGLHWSSAWDRMDYLLFVPLGEKHGPLRYHFAYIHSIETDLDLRHVLGLAVSDDQPVTIRAAFHADDHTVGLSLQNITGAQMMHSDVHDRSACMAWLDWRTQYQGKLQVHLHCADPNRIIDSSGLWSSHAMGPPPQDLISPAQMSMYIYKEKMQPVHHDVFTLYHFGSEQIDLAEFLLQIDLDHSVFHTPDWCSILVQPNTGFRCREISLSRV